MQGISGSGPGRNSLNSSHLEQFWTPDGLAPDLAIERMREMLERVLEILENYAMWSKFGLRKAFR